METANELFQEYAEGPIELIGQGMEGAVYDLGGELVGKTWFHRSAADLHPLRLFLEELAGENLPFGTPEIRAVDEFDGRAVSVERKLHGTPLRTALETGVVTQTRGFDIFVEVLAALSTTNPGQATTSLPVLGEATSLWQASANKQIPAEADGSSGGGSAGEGDTGGEGGFGGERYGWGAGLAGLVAGRAAQGERYLRVDVDGFEEMLERVVGKLRGIEVGAPRVVHGDICTPNLLVDDQGKLTALLDWGFLTTAGDSTFDAGLAAGFYDMYGPDARTIDELLLDRFEKELGHERERMLLYRAAYAIITATIYSPDASDGHYKWCVDNLNRPEVRAAIS